MLLVAASCLFYYHLGCKPIGQEPFVPCTTAAADNVIINENIGNILQPLLLCFPDTAHQLGTTWPLEMEPGMQSQRPSPLVIKNHLAAGSRQLHGRPTYAFIQQMCTEHLLCARCCEYCEQVQYGSSPYRTVVQWSMTIGPGRG